MKLSIKNFIISTLFLLCTVMAFVTADSSRFASATPQTTLKVYVVDTENVSVHNAKVTILETKVSFNSDNRGYSPRIDIDKQINCYNESITEWFCVTILVSKEGYVNSAVVNCVLKANNNRNITVRLYKKDSSDLKCVTYVEAPPDEYIDSLFAK